MASQDAADASRPAGSPAGFRFATIAALIRNEGYTHADAEDLLRTWQRYARYAMMSEKSPVSTAEHLARFEHFQPGPPSRDPTRGLPHAAPTEIVDRQIAEDLRRHADSIGDDDPEHARELYAVSDHIEFAPSSTNDLDIARIAADAVHGNTPKKRLTPEPAARDGQRTTTAIVSIIFPPEFSARDVKQWTKSRGFVSTELESSPSGATRVAQRPISLFEAHSFHTIVLSESENIHAVVGRPRHEPRPNGTETSPRRRPAT